MPVVVEDNNRIRTVRLVTLALIPNAPLFGALFAWGGAYVSSIGALLGGALALIAFAMLRAGRPTHEPSYVLTVALWAALLAAAWETGGPTAPAAAWFCLVPLIALSLIGRRAGLVWLIIACGSVVGLHAIHAVEPFVAVVPPGVLRAVEISGDTVLAMLVFAITWFWYASSDASRRSLLSANSDLNDARERADAANVAKSQFLANMSHEIRTPLNAVIGYTELVLEEPLETEIREDLCKVKGAAGHLLGIVDDILDLARLEGGDLTLHPEPVQLRQLAEEVADLVRPNLAEGVELEVRGETFTALLDRQKTSQVLLNLLANAAKFTREGRIEVRLQRWEEGVSFEVSDTGIGIPADRLAHVFDKFTQADDSATREHGGTGLGLAISRSLVEVLGGEISVESTLGEGSTFFVRIPGLGG